jgi:ankyrin repeat protein
MRHSAIIDTDTDANAADIARFVEEEVERLSTDKRLLRGRLVKNKRLRKKTIRKLKAGAQGMFRWVVLSLETLIAINHPNDFEESLGKLPPKLSELYDIIFKQLEQAGPHEQDIVKRLLQWLLCAQRVFSVDELIYAVSEPANFEAAQARASQTDHSSSGNTSADDEALSDEDPSLDGEDSYEDSTDTDPMLQAADIVLFCRSLLSHDLAQNTLRFSHQSVREYLLTKKANFVLQAHSLAMERCLWQIERLNINMEEIGIRTPPGVVATFASYALLFWPIHARETLQDRATVSDSSYSQAMNFLISGDELDAPYSEWNMCVNRLWKRSFPNADLLLRSVGGTPAPLFAICSFNLLSIMENTTFQESVNDWNCRNIEDQTALIIAAASGSSKIVHHLLAISTVEVNAQDRWGCTALSAAAAEGHEHIVELLLAIEEVDANLANLWDRTPVIHAAKLGNGAILAKLIDSGKSDPYRTDEEGLWALSMAAWEGHELMVKQLLNVPDIKVDYGGQGSRTALSCAVERGFQSIVELLLTTENVNVNATSRGTTILCHAIRTGNEEVVQLLLETGKLDVAAKNEDGSTALICAVEAKNETLVKLLLDLGKIDINARDQDGNTALMMAVTTESSSMVGLILDSGTANVHLKGWIARTEYTPLTLARWNEHDDIVKQLERYAALHQRSEDTEWFERYAALYPQAEDGDCSESE